MAIVSLSMEEYTGYLSGYLVLHGLWVTPLAVLFFISLCLARRQGDPARHGIAWYKGAHGTFILYLLFRAISTALALWFHLADQYFDYRKYLNVERAQIANHAVSIFFKFVGDVSLFIAFVELAIGFLSCLQSSNGLKLSPSFARTARIAIGGWAFILLIIFLTYFGMSQDYNRVVMDEERNYYSSYSDSDFDDWRKRTLLTITRLSGAYHILTWLITIPLLGLAAFVMHRVRQASSVLKSSAALYLSAAVLNLVRKTATCALEIHLSLRDAEKDIYGSYRDWEEAHPATVYVVEPLFDNVPLFVLLVLLYVLATRRTRAGLWANPRPEWDQTYVYVQGGYAVPVVPVVQPQQQQFQQQVYVVQQQHPNAPVPAYLRYAQDQGLVQQQQQQQQQQQPQQPAP